MHQRSLSSAIFLHFKSLKKFQFDSHYRFASSRTITADTTQGIDADADHLYTDIPKPTKRKSDRKPYPTPMKILVQRAKQEREVRKAQPCKLLEEPPENGLLVPELVAVAHQVYRARELVLLGLSKLVNVIPVFRCRHCGYCSEVHVGPKGHKVGLCKASKYQSRNGMHAWQEATIGDLVGPNYVWHVADVAGPSLVKNLKRFYSKAPAVVELCVQAGAPVPDQYTSMMRLDVVPPCSDELDLVT